MSGYSKKRALIPLLVACIAASTGNADMREDVAADYDYILELYTHFHQNPELSFRESMSSARMARELEALGFDVTTGIGDRWVRNKVEQETGAVPPGLGGYGLVALMRNGNGPTLMMRADMDALPLQEKTGLPYASAVVSVDYRGQEVPVMHACAHDSHMAILIGAARRLVDLKDQWSGTLVMIGQPAEELGVGALAMLDDGLYERFPKPDYVIAEHTSGWDPAGYIVYTAGFGFANVDSVDIYIRGVGTHGSAPHLGKDPIVIGAQIVNALQTLVAREIDPQDAGVVTVGAFQAGYKHNIISDEAHLQLTVRSYSDEVRQTLLSGIRRIALAQARSAGLPDELMPIVEVEQDATPATYNDPALTERVMGAVAASLGEQWVRPRAPSMGGEDFSYYGRTDDDIPILIFWVGGLDPEGYEAAQAGEGPPLPGNHSPLFSPVIEPTLKTGVQAMTAAALELLGPP